MKLNMLPLSFVVLASVSASAGLPGPSVQKLSCSLESSQMEDIAQDFELILTPSSAQADFGQGPVTLKAISKGYVIPGLSPDSDAQVELLYAGSSDTYTFALVNIASGEEIRSVTADCK